MGRVLLQIEDATQRLLLSSILRAAGHEVVNTAPEVHISDSPRRIEPDSSGRTLILTTVGGVPEAVEAMRRGAFGYILLPFQPGEAELMVERVLEHQGRVPEVSRMTATNPSRSLAEVEQEHIAAVLRHCRQNQAQAARMLGIGRNTLWRKLKQMEAQGNEPRA